MRKSLPCSEVLPPPPESWREASVAWSAVAEELCRIPVVAVVDDCEICDCAEERPCCCEACELGLRCEEEEVAEDGKADPEAELRSEAAELASSIWRSLGVDKFFRILLRGKLIASIHPRGDKAEDLFCQIDPSPNF